MIILGWWAAPGPWSAGQGWTWRKEGQVTNQNQVKSTGPENTSTSSLSLLVHGHWLGCKTRCYVLSSGLISSVWLWITQQYPYLWQPPLGTSFQNSSLPPGKPHDISSIILPCIKCLPWSFYVFVEVRIKCSE